MWLGKMRSAAVSSWTPSDLTPPRVRNNQILGVCALQPFDLLVAHNEFIYEAPAVYGGCFRFYALVISP